MSLIRHHPDSLFNLYEVPFSFFGSWNSIKIPLGENEICFGSHHTGSSTLFPIKLIHNKTPISPIVLAEPWMLTLEAENNPLHICFENTETIRMKGENVSLQLGEKDLMYQCGEDLFTINKPFTRRYQIQILKGSAKLIQLVETQPVYPKIIEINPDKNGEFEIAIDKYKSTWVQPKRKTFEECISHAKESFCKFLNSMPNVRECDNKANKVANYINWATCVSPEGYVKRQTLLMSKFKMDKVWSWDHAFNAMALSSGQAELAQDQMLTMIDHQDEFGCYPDSFSDMSITYNFSKPPVHGWALGEMMSRLKEPPSFKFLETMFNALIAQTNWWMTHRVLKGTKLPYYLHGNDSGWDNSTMFKKGVPLITPDLSALLIIQMDEISNLSQLLGDDNAAKIWKEKANQLFHDLMSELWKEDKFVAKLGLENKDIESNSLIPHLPIILGKRLTESARHSLAENIKKHLTEWGLATELTTSEFYDPDGYWRGPIWAPSTFIAVTGLERSGYRELARDIAERFCKMGKQSGFPENYNALTGEALRCPAYTWTSSVFLLLADKLNKEQVSD